LSDFAVKLYFIQHFEFISSPGVMKQHLFVVNIGILRTASQNFIPDCYWKFLVKFSAGIMPLLNASW